MKTIRFNVNDCVKVRLTDYGKRCLRKNYDDLQAGLGKKLGFPFRLPEEDENGWSEWQAGAS